MYKLTKKKKRLIEKWTKDKNDLNKEIQVILRQMKNSSVLFIIREMQVKTMLKYQFSPIWLAKLKRT